MRTYRISGRRKFQGKQYGITGFSKNRRNAQQLAILLRRNGANARVVPLKSANGYGIYANARKIPRKYNYVRVPWRNFSDSLIGVDVVAMDQWLRNQPGYNPNLNWKQNLQAIGGPDAMATLETLTDPRTAVQNKMLESEANKALAKELDFLLVDAIEEGFRPENILSANNDAKLLLGESLDPFERAELETALVRSDERLDDEYGVGLDFDVLIDPDTGEQKPVSEIDIFELLGLDDGTSPEWDDNFGEVLGDWFDQELAEYGKDADETEKVVKGTSTALELLSNKEKDDRNAIGTIASRELNSMIEDVFLDAVWGDDSELGDEIDFGGRTITRPPNMMDLNPALGRPQPSVDPNAPAGYWTFQPLGAAGAVDFGELRTDTRDVFMVVDSLGSMIANFPYTKEPGESDSISEFEAMNNAIIVARQTSQFDPYRTDSYQDYGKLSPGIAVIDSTLTIDDKGQWLGWDPKLTEEDFRLDVGNFMLFINNQKMERGEVPAEQLSRWILPQRVQQVGAGDANRQRFEFLVGEEGAREAYAQAEGHAQLARAEIAKSQGGGAQEVLDALLGNQFMIRSNYNNDQLTTFMPSYRAALEALSSLQASAEISGFSPEYEDVSIIVAPTNPDGSTNIAQSEVFGTAKRNDNGEYALIFR